MSAAIEPPRFLVVAAGGWFVGALALGLGARVPESLALASLFPPVRISLLATVAGLLVAWPLLRLTLATPRRCVAVTLVEMMTLMVLFQAVMWPLRLATPWSIERTLLIDALALSAMTGVTGVVAFGAATSSAVVRAVAMAVVLALSTGITSIAWLGTGIPGVVDAMGATASMPTPGDWRALVGASGANLALLVIGVGASAIVAGGRGPMLAHPPRVG